jgi:hypothetical protein
MKAAGARGESVAWLAAVAVLGVLAYAPGLHTGYFADDFQYVYEPECLNFRYHLLNTNPGNDYAYRPIEAWLLVLTQKHFGPATWPIHGATLGLHILFAWVVFLVMRRWDVPRPAAALGSAFMLLSQANAHAVLSNDTFSQVAGPFFGCVSLWLLHGALVREREAGAPAAGRPRMLCALGVYALGLLAKETNVCFLGMAFLLLAAAWRREGGRAWRRPLLRLALFAGVTVLYLGWRSWVVGAPQARLGTGRYDLALGANVVRNTALLLSAVWMPGSSVAAFVAAKGRDVLTLAYFAAVGGVFSALVAYGFFSLRRRAVAAWMGVFALCSFFPVVLLNHVSELYGYNAMPFVSVAVGLALGEAFRRTGGRPPARWLLAAFLLLFAAGHVAGVRQKAALMGENGRRADALLRQIATHVPEVPPGGRLLLVNPPDDRPEYSIFCMNGFRVLANGLHRVRQVAGRKDFRVGLVKDPRTLMGPATVALTLSKEEGKVVRWKEPGGTGR